MEKWGIFIIIEIESWKIFYGFRNKIFYIRFICEMWFNKFFVFYFLFFVRMVIIINKFIYWGKSFK